LTAPKQGHCLAKRIPMNKADLVDEVHRMLGDGTSRAAAERAADTVLQAIRRGLKRDAEVHLVGFGTFSVAQRSARKGFNPHTRKPMKIPAMKLVRFKAGSSLRGIR
jgi:DNA-binding protein HU-beta